VDEGDEGKNPATAGAAVQGLYDEKKKVQNGASERGDVQ